MGQRVHPVELIWRDGPALFEFLLDADFLGPERTDEGIAYHRPGLHIEIRFVDGHEPEVATTVVRVAQPDAATRFAHLDCLYLACGCGVLQDVPTGAPTLRAAAKRIRQQANGLRRVLPHLLGDDVERLLRRCQGRLVPDP